jgi:hypothetical protein
MNNRRTVAAFGRAYSIARTLQALTGRPFSQVRHIFITQNSAFVPKDATR